jgi:hypothetical protein
LKEGSFRPVEDGLALVFEHGSHRGIAGDIRPDSLREYPSVFAASAIVPVVRLNAART